MDLLQQNAQAFSQISYNLSVCKVIYFIYFLQSFVASCVAYSHIVYTAAG